MPSEVAQLLDGDRYCTYLALNFAARKATAPVKFSELLKKAPSRMKRALLEPEWNREDRCKLLRVAVRMNRSAFEGQLIELLELGGRDRVEAEAIRLLGEVGGVAALAALRLRHSAALGGLALSDESQEGGQLSVAASGELALAAEPTDPKTPA